VLRSWWTNEFLNSALHWNATNFRVNRYVWGTYYAVIKTHNEIILLLQVYWSRWNASTPLYNFRSTADIRNSGSTILHSTLTLYNVYAYRMFSRNIVYTDPCKLSSFHFSLATTRCNIKFLHLLHLWNSNKCCHAAILETHLWLEIVLVNKLALCALIQTKVNKLVLCALIQTKVNKLVLYALIQTKVNKLVLCALIQTKVNKLVLCALIQTKVNKLVLHASIQTKLGFRH